MLGRVSFRLEGSRSGAARGRALESCADGAWMVAGGAEEHARVYVPTWRGMHLAVTELARRL
jgi:hypothetical protein